MNKRHILTMTLLLTALLMAGNAAAGVKVKGNVYGGGNEADVQMNTTVNIGGGIVEGNVYGGGNLGDVGKINDKSDKANYSWTGTDNQRNSPGGANNTGVCSVHITGTTVLIGPSGENATADKDHGNVFGGGKGDDNSGFYCEKGMVYSTSVEISAGTVKGTVYGGGEVGRVEDNTIVTIGAAGANGDTNTPVINGDVFGAGKGLKTHGYSALVRGNPVVTVQGKTLVGGSVYGGGEIASVGRHKVKTSNSPLTPSDAPAALPVGMPYTLANTNLGKCTVTIKDNVTITGNVFGAGQGLDDYNYDSNNKPRRMGMSDWEDLDSEELYHVFLQTLALATDTHVTIEGSANVNGSVFGGSESGFVQYDTNVTIKSGAIGVDVYGGGRGLTNNTIAGRVNGNTNVHILGGTITHDVYGGAALAKSNAGATSYTATVNLLGGTIGGNAYGGGLGDANTAADVGSTKVNLNGMALSEYNVNSTLYSSYLTAIDVNGDGDTTDEGVDYYIANKAKGCVVSNIFGANNVNGTPLGNVTVHVYATQNKNLSTIGNKVPLTFTEPKTGKLTYWTTQATSIGLTPETIIGETSDEDEKIDLLKAAIESNRYDVEAVYGGGNKAAYIPTAAWNGTTGSKSQVIIDGCDYTSIDYVYGGGNAAPVPATDVTINSCYEVNYLFGGGNGYGVGNPGADVGIYKVNDVETAYGTGVATTKLVGGTIHYVYGGSNTRGNVREETSLERTESNSCPLKIDEIYGAGQVAPMDGNVNIVLECMPDEFVDKVFGGAKNATIDGNVSLTVTSGKYGRVFGGNNEGGSINGSITVNAYEDGCKPLIIGELYGGGFNAPYSIWGCNDDDNNGTWTPNEHTSEDTPHVAESADAISVNVFSCTSIGKVFGGSYGETADVVGNTHVWINTMQGIVDGEKQTYATEPDVYIGKIGQVFGGGNAASVKGDITIDIGTATVYNYNKETEAEKIGVRIISGDDYLNATSNTSTSITAGIYGGGYAANVDGNVTLNIGTVEQNQGIKIGGDIFGGGYGETTHVTGNVTVNIGGTDESGTPVGYANITGDVYGGSAKGKVNSYLNNNVETASEGKTTQVNLYGGTITGNLYGGGLGEATHAANVYGPVTVNVKGGKATKVFGCNNVLGSPQSTATVNINGTEVPESSATYTITSVYGGGDQAAYNGTGGVSVLMSGGYVNDVFGGGLGATAIVNEGTTVTLNGGTVTNDIYGGGSQANVTGAVNVTLNGGTVARDVYGGGALAQTNTEYVAGDATKGDYITTINLGDKELPGIVRGTTIIGNLYGGGLGRLASGSDEAIAANVNGPVTVNVDGGMVYNVFGCNNINGSPQSTVKVNIKGTADPTFEVALPIHNVYGGGNQAKYTFADAENPLEVNISGGTMDNVFGGGLSADVVGSIEVNVTGGTIINDVYGGGALANTNTGNWNTSTNTWDVEDATATDYYEKVKHLKTGDDVSSFYIESGGSHSQASGTYVENTDYYKKLTYNPNIYNIAKADGHTQYTTTVSLRGGTIGNAYGGGLGQLGTGIHYTQGECDTHNAALPGYIASGATLTADQATWFNSHKDASDETVYAADQTVTGETMLALAAIYNTSLPGAITTAGWKTNPGDGEGAVKAMVYGDVEVTVNGTAFTNDVEYISGGSENVAKHGRVFGCNNLNGTPKGKVTVQVLATKRTDGSNNHIKGELEIQGVYGGGNLANYEPETYDKTDDNVHTGQTEFGQKTKVIINGCSNVSINKVYGGGNAASVPFTDVNIEGAFEIGYVFGGGNGGDKVNYGSGWVTNPGADVTHYANVMLMGGTIGQAFGGSDTRGTVGGTDVKQSTSAECPLRIVNLYGAGNGDEATSDGDVNITVSACGDGSEIQNVFGGSYKANIKGAVNLTIKSGIFTSVYGGNDRMGSIGGNITVNIEETDDCSKPIIIQNLYGGCYQTAYPGPDAKYKDTDGVLHPFTSGDITVNVKSATRIDRIFGGSENGSVTGNTTVNINMVEGSQSGKTDVALPSYYGETGALIPSNITVTVREGGYVEVHGLVTEQDAAADNTKEASSVVGYYTKSGESDYTPATGFAQAGVTYYKKSVKGNIAEGIGSIGEVYGGGNRGNVSGNAAVNIGTEEAVNMVSLNNASKTVLGAHIDGNVYGGGNLADVKGNTDVNICVKKNGSGVYEALSEGTKHVTIGGNVYGGGKGDDDTYECEKGMVGENNANNGNYANVDKGTHVRIGNGTIGTLTNGKLKVGTGNVYGGGEVGRVEFHSVVTIGLTPKTGVATSAPEILGNVFGGGQGVETHGYSALLRGNTTVTVQQNAKVRNSVYGGGEIATIGRFFVKNVNDGSFSDKNNPKYKDVPTGMPYALRDGGKCIVNILDSVEIGPTTLMDMPTFAGNVFGGGKGIVPKVYDYTAEDDEHKPRRISVGNAKDYFKDIAAYLFFIETLALVNEAHVTINNNAFVKGSVYGGSENGRVLSDTHVTIANGQIGWGKNAGGVNGRHLGEVWNDNYTPTTDLECPSWTYDKTDPAPYDPFALTDAATYDYTLSNFSVIPQAERLTSSEGGKRTGKDGHTYYGNVFGGGSGKDPYAPGKWHRKAGAVGGNTYVNITGGHILTCVYGGNEHTDVGTYGSDELTPVSDGKCTINMTGGTLGVPRTLEQITNHPVTCYLFGAGKGDQRIFFNTWTNVISTEVNITGNARIYGSTFGGGEDGHVMNDAKTKIGGSVTIGETTYTHTNVKIGTTGTSYVDGNVFGGGRGFSGEAQTAGTVGGNVTMTISGGTMLGSVYGGGRLASVGTYFTAPNSPLYGQFQENDDSNTYGHVTIDITGGAIIGNTEATGDGAKYSGNVFGGSMGRLTLLNDEINPLWPELGETKNSTVTISGSGTHIIRNVYGGGEYGTVRENATVTISDGAVVDSCVYGGGYGSSDYQHPTTIEVHWGGGNKRYTYTPMQWAGNVGGNTSVSINNATVKKNVYGGGELASVGIINYEVDENGNYIDIHKHDTITTNGNSLYNFGLSWPYEFKYIPCKPNTTEVGGKATVTITGDDTVIGLYTDADDIIDGFVFGGGKGKVSFGSSANGTDDDITKQRYIEAFCANVRETDITIGKSDDTDKLKLRTVYGGGEDGHVYQDTKITINNGTINRTVFGGGKGTSTYSGKLLTNSSSPAEYHADSIHSWTAGKVYGNTSVTMNDGSVGWFIYGGGNMASVGKGNYAGGSDDYAPNGYGELPPQSNQALWTNPDTENTYPYYFKHSGNATVTILGGKVGPTSAPFSGDADGVPHGSIFGSSRGKAAANCIYSPRYKYVPDFFLGYVNKAVINIGGYIENGDTTIVPSDGPEIYGSIYGGGQDGHVRNSTEVNIFKGQVLGQTTDTSGRSGNVFGAGSGIGKYKDGSNYYCNNSSGSVTCTTQVHIFGGSVSGSVYGGGALASVGPPNTGTQNGQGFNELNTLDPYTKRPSGFSSAHGSLSYNKVTIEGGIISGSVYGASRGPSTTFLTSAFTGVDSSTDPDKYNPTRYATSIWTEVNIKDHFNEDGTLKSSPTISGSVYGGGEMGQVKESTVVNLTGGSIAHEAYGGGKGTKGTDLSGTNAIAADIGGSTFVELNKGVADNAKGCSVERIFGCNDLNGTPRGHVKVHVHATQNKATETILDKVAPPKYSTKRDTTQEGYIDYLRRILNVVYEKNGGGTIIEPHALISTRISSDTINRVEGFYTAMHNIGENSLSKGNKEAITTAAKNVIKEIEKMHDYDVAAVYGGGNLAQYQPYGAAANNTAADYKATTEKTEVIIEGCDVTSIKQVYGGGNAASVPSTDVSVKSVFIIDELFGGGNGFDNYTVDNLWYQNPGANVGYYATEEHITNGSQNGSTEANRFLTKAKPNSSTKDDRITHYSYGSGRAKTTVTGGRIHTVYGGSNEKGNIRTVALSQYQKSGTCPLITDESYGGSKTAEMDGEIQVVMDCVEEGGTYFGGSQNADINNNVTINITNGTYDKVYGGNNKAGTINGAITINIEEKGCTPIIIGELYGGGYYAPYSVYGYKKLSNGKYETVKEVDPTNNTDTIYSRIPLQADSVGALATPHRDPYINIISATSIGKIFGGGDRAKVIGNTHVNVNMQKGIILEEYAKEQTGYSSLTVANGGIDNDGNKILPIGTIGDIYGGGNLADVIGNTYVDIGTGSWYNYETDEIETINRKEAKITGNVFGGGKGEAPETGPYAFTCEEAMVGKDGGGVTDSQGNTSVVIGNGSIGGSVYGGGEIGRVENNTSVTIGIEGNKTNELTIGGNVFGAGKGVETHGYSALVRGNSHVTIQGKAKVGGCVYGGGEKATIGRYWINDGTTEEGKPTVPKDTPQGYPYAARGGGECTVVVKDDAEIGPDNMVMINTETGKPDNTGHVFGASQGVTPGDSATAKHMTKANGMVEGFANNAAYLEFIETLALATKTDVTIGGNAFVKGDVFGGAEQGFVQQDTHVTIEGNCQIGNGYVQMNAAGEYLNESSRYSLNRRYTEKEWTDGHLENVVGYENSLPECASWLYGQATGNGKYAAHDPFAGTAGYDSKGGSTIADNGSTFYGNVFGGGSGYFPYAAGKWHWKAGDVGGNTVVDIKGGHILTNVYGGNELTNVGRDDDATTGKTTGKCTINMSGGTIGVPRTLGQITAHPVTCYLFGAGKGDPRVMFNKQTNVKDVEVNVTGGWIYGSVFGGGEDGHVMRNVTLNISGNEVDKTKTSAEAYAELYAGNATKIGTWGTSYVDGNIFGGGRGFGGEAYTAGNVAGAVTMEIKGGEILGSVYGGGRLGSVGYGLYDEGVNGYGEMRNDDKYDDGTNGAAFFTKGRGHVKINITGGTIGNTNEFIVPQASNIPTGLNANIKKWTPEDWTTWKKHNNVPNTTYDTSNGRVLHTKGGNVYAGGMGRYTQLEGSNPISEYDAETGVLSSPIEWTKLGNVKSTNLTISGENTWIMGDVYGGGELGAVTPYEDNTNAQNPVVEGGSTTISITGGTIGTEITGGTPVKATVPVPENGNSNVLYTYGSVYGGGEGQEDPDANERHGGEVKGNTTVGISGDTKVRASVFGGGEMAMVGGDTYITISGGEIGRNEVKSKNSDNPGYVKFGSSTMGNVYGGGKGHKNYVEAGLVKGNTNITIKDTKADAAYAEAHTGVTEGDVLSSPKIYHMVYGGGALASVGTFDVSKKNNEGKMVPAYMPIEGIPYQWKYTNGDTINPAQPQGDRTPTGTATITITGGTIGISGRDNGLVFGGSRGDISDSNVYYTQTEADSYNTEHGLNSGDKDYKTTNDIKSSGFDPYLKVAWVNKTIVNIGTKGSGTNYKTPIIKGSVYGGGENGHNYSNATVNVYSGTIGISDKDPATGATDPWWSVGDDDLDKKYRADRGNVYGAGSGVDTYTDRKGNKHYNPKTGMVGGNTVVNIKGGHIGRSVYGAGAMASVGNITNARDTIEGGSAKHANEANGFALSWPYKFDFAPNTGKATVRVTGGHIGTKDVDGGDVFGGARGKAGDRYTTAHVAFVGESVVNIDYPETPEESKIPTINDDFSIPCVTGSVMGSGEDGYVYGDTHVTLNNGLIGHSLYGAGKGKGTYTVTLKKVGGEDGDTYESDIYSLISGKVMGNTYVTMNSGYVVRNVYGGGNMASVGKGNYAGGADDYYTGGYGETLNNATEDNDKILWDASKNDNSLAFMNSGITTVKVFGGQVGLLTKDEKNELPYGNVFGGSAGESAPNVPKDLSPRYHYCPAFFSGYVNETHVTIGGGYRCIADCTDNNATTPKSHAVGETLTTEEIQAAYPNGTIPSDKWEAMTAPKILASVYGGGQDGHVRRDANVTVVSGEIGLPYNSTNIEFFGTDNLDSPQWLHRGNVFGAGSGISKYTPTLKYADSYTGNKLLEPDYSTSAGSVTRFTNIDILGGTIHRNVYGGGSMGSVGAPPIPPTRADMPDKKGDTTPGHGSGWQSQCTVNIGGGPSTVYIGTPTDYKEHYGGEVYGASRGISELSELGSVIWTQVNIKNGTTIMGNVFGGGDAGMVKQDSEVNVGEKAKGN